MPSSTNGQDLGAFAEGLLDQAEQLHQERADVYARITANREMLRNLAKTGATTEEQNAQIEEFYPARERKGGKGKQSQQPIPVKSAA